MELSWHPIKNCKGQMSLWSYKCILLLLIGHECLPACPELNLSPKPTPCLFPTFMRDTTIHLARYLVTILNSSLLHPHCYCFQLLNISGICFFPDPFLLLWYGPPASLAPNPYSIELELCVIHTIHQCLAHRKYLVSISK